MPSLHTLLLLPLLFLSLSLGYVDQWHSFTNQEKISSLIFHQGFVYAGTQGGIRRIHPKTLEQITYNNLNGLLDCEILGLSQTQDGKLWAVSRSGFIYTLVGNRWETKGRSYASQGWLMNPRSVKAAGNFLYLGSEKGLALFDTKKNISQANLIQFSDQVGVSVLSTLRRGDTLFIGTTRGVFKAGIDFSDPINPRPPFNNILDPRNWLPVTVSNPSNTPLTEHHVLSFIGDSVVSYGPGTILEEPFHVEVLFQKKLQIGTKVFPIEFANHQAATIAGEDVFLGGPAGGLRISNYSQIQPQINSLPKTTQYPGDPVANIATHASKIWTQTYFGIHHFNPKDKGFYFDTTGIYWSSELFLRSLKNLTPDKKGSVYAGSWGGGIFRIQEKSVRIWNHKTDPCIFENEPNFPVVHAVSNVYQDDFYFSMFRGEFADKHQLVHLNTATDKISCFDSLVIGGKPHSLRVFSDSLLGVGTEKGVAFYQIQEGIGSPILKSLGQWTADGESKDVWEMATDAFGRPWALIGNRLAYVDSLPVLNISDSLKKFIPIEGFSGKDCQVLKADPLGLFWIGCSNGLFHVRPNVDGIEVVRRYGLDEGLLSTVIYDLSIDPTNGHIWIATERGVNMLESRSQPAITVTSQIKAYPNPFQSNHRFVIFDHLPRNSTVRIHAADSKILRTIRPSNLAGNQAQWDGKNESGHSVAPGIYLYTVTSGSSITRGKLIVAR